MSNVYKLLVALLLLISSVCYAGSAQKAALLFPVEQVELFAKQVEKYAAKKGAHAFIIARLGQPAKELPKGIEFTHTAIAIYSDITLQSEGLKSGEKVKGYAIHNLYQKMGQADKSELVIDYPIDFFWGANALKAGILIPTLDVQQRIIEVIASGKNKALFNENYSVIANPYNSVFQNCTEHTLDIINAAIYQTTDIAQLKNNTKQYFQAQRVKINPLKLLLGSLFIDDVSTKDHKGKIKTATFTSITKYLQENDLLVDSVVLNGKVIQRRYYKKV